MKKINKRGLFNEQSELLNDILQSMIVGVAKVNMEGIITFANEAALASIEDPNMVGRFHMSDDIDQIDINGNVIKPANMPLSRTLAKGEIVRGFQHGLMISNKLKWFSANSSPLISNGKQIGAIVNFMNITEEIESRKKLQESEELYRLIAENTGDIISLLHPNDTYHYISPNVKEVRGYTLEEIEKYPPRYFIHPSDLDLTKKAIESLKKGEKTKIKYRYLHKDGKYYWYESNSHPIFDDKKQLKYYQITTRPIHEQKIAEETLVESEARFKALAENIPGLVYMVALDDKFTTVYVNDEIEKITGYPKKDFLDGSLTIASLTHQEDLRLNLDKRNKALTIGGSFILEYRLQKKSGDWIWIRDTGVGVKGPDNNFKFVEGYIEDITERRKTLEDLKTSEEFQHETINALSIGLMVMKTDGEIEQTNLVWDRISENTKNLAQAKKGNNFLQIIKNLTMGFRVSNGISEILKGESDLLEIELSFDRAGDSWFALRASKLKPELESVVITLQEITFRKRIEKDLEKSLIKYRNIYNMTPVMMQSIDPNGVLLSVSDFWLEKLGYQRHEVIGKRLQQFLTSESKKDADIILPVFFQKGFIFDVSYNFVKKNGDILDTLVSAIKEGETGAFRSLAVVTDITSLKKTERQLRKSRYELEESQKIARLGNYEFRLRDKTFTSSEVCDSLLELEGENPKQTDFLEKIIPPEDMKRVKRTFRQALSKGGMFEYTGRIFSLKSKKITWVELISKVVREKGVPIKIIGTIQDITKSKLSELEIQKLSERLSLATQSANIGVWENNKKTNELQWDEQMTHIYGKRFKTWKESIDITHPDDRHVTKNFLRRLKDGESLVDETRRIVVNNKIKYVRNVIRQIFDKEGNPTKQVGVALDVTKDQELFNKLENSLAEKNILIKEVHHRVKNNMQLISSILSLKSMELTDIDSKNIFNNCTTRIKSMAVVHDQLYRFDNVSEINILAYLNHLISGLHPLLRDRAGNFTVKAEAVEYTINVDQALLCGLIVSEIVFNAFKHAFKEVEEGEVTVKFEVKEEEKFLIITNTGAEIPKDILEARTSTLGISLIKTFVSQLRGTLELHPDNGFQVKF